MTQPCGERIDFDIRSSDRMISSPALRVRLILCCKADIVLTKQLVSDLNLPDGGYNLQLAEVNKHHLSVPSGVRAMPYPINAVKRMSQR